MDDYKNEFLYGFVDDFLIEEDVTPESLLKDAILMEKLFNAIATAYEDNFGYPSFTEGVVYDYLYSL